MGKKPTTDPELDILREKISSLTKKAIKITKRDILPVSKKILIGGISLTGTILRAVLTKKPRRPAIVCLKCDSWNINTVKPSLSDRLMPGSALLLLGPIGLLAKKKKPLHVCRDCGFSWER